MKKNTIILFSLLSSVFAFSQVGINTSDPKATLDITAKEATGISRNVDGLLIPRVDRERAQSMTGTPVSTLIYVNNIEKGLPTGTAINIDDVGYYYFDGSFWVKLIAPSPVNPMVNIYNSDGTLTNNRTVTIGGNNLIFSGTTGIFQVSGNTNGLYRSYLRNASTVTNSRMDVNIGAGSANIYLGADNSSAIFGAGTKAYLDNHSGGRFVFGTNGVENVTFATSGNVGIGTANPTRKLDVQGSQSINAARTAGTTNDALDINIGQDGYAYGNRATNFGINMRTSSSVHTGDVARINFGDTGTTTNTGNRYLSFSVGKTLKELMYMDDINGGRIGIGTNSPNSNAALEISSTNQGFLPPRLTTAQRDAIPAATKPAGLMVYNTTTNCMDFWNSSAWVSMCGATTPPAGSIIAVTCASATNNGTITTGVNNSVTSSIPYTGGNGGSHGGQTVTSTGVTGLTATLSAGSFANGPGNLIYTITGTPSAVGNANFAINIGGRTCTLTRAVTLPVGAIATLNCDGATNNGTLTGGTAASGVSSVIPYTGGNAGPHGGQVVASTGVTGLTATLTAGTFANGVGNLTYTITGTPSTSGTATFAINIGGRTCLLTRTVVGATTPPTVPFTCTADSFAIPFVASGTTVSGAINGVPVTATITYNSYVVKGTAYCGMPANGVYRVQGYGVLKIKFNRKVSNLGANALALSTGNSAQFTFRNNGTVVNPTQAPGYIDLCGSNSYIYRTGYTGVWFDEIEFPYSTGDTLYNICLNSIQ